MENKQNHYQICVEETNIQKQTLNTNDQIIRAALKTTLHELHKDDLDHRVIEELGVNHGSVRADVTVVNGFLDCYEIKSDQDTLLRLPGQIRSYNAVFDRVTIVVGLTHVYEAIEMIPDWWGIMVAKAEEGGSIVFSHIREAQFNQEKDSISIARLLWREEALRILEELDHAQGLYSKPRSVIYEKLAASLNINLLSDRVRLILCSRKNWRIV